MKVRLTPKPIRHHVAYCLSTGSSIKDIAAAYQACNGFDLNKLIDCVMMHKEVYVWDGTLYPASCIEEDYNVEEIP